jgi:uncharacterized membrane protein
MTDLFKVVYSGKLKGDTRAEEAIVRLAAAFNLSQDAARTLILGGRPHVLKNDVDKETAERYRTALEQVGMIARIEPMRQPKPVWDLEPIDDPREKFRVKKAPAAAVGPSGDNGRKQSRQPPPPPPEVSLAEAPPDHNPAPGRIHGPSRVSARHGWTWVAHGFRYFAAHPWAWMLAVLVFAGLSVVIGLVPFIGGLVATLLSTVFTGGLMVGVHEQDEGRPFRVEHLFAGFSNSPRQLVLVAVLYLAGTLAIVVLIGLWMVLAAGPLMSSLEASAIPTGDAAILHELMGPTVLLALLVGALFLIPLMMGYFFAPALVVLDGKSAMAAMKLSFVGCLKNVLPFLLYGLIGLALLFLCAISLGIGLLVVMPALVASVYAAYRDIYHSA